MDNNVLENGSNLEGKEADDEVFMDVSSGSLESEDMSGTVYEGPVYHVGVNRVGRHFCHLRFLRISGIHVEMFKKEPQSDTVKPIRRGIAGRFLKVEDLGRRKVEDNDLYVLKLSNSLDDTTKGEIACRTALEAQRWRDAFLHARDQADALYQQGNGLKLKDQAAKFNLDGHRPRLRRYAKGLTKLTTIGRGSDYQLKKQARSSQNGGKVYANKQDDDIFDVLDWRCVRTVNGIRILEDASSNVTEKMVILKSVGVIEASPGAIFEMLMDITNPHRREWDILTGDMKLVEQVDGHSDIVYGTFDPKYLRRWNPKSDFVFSRVWRHDPDNTYSILQSSESHKNCPKRSGFHRITLNPTIWEIKPLRTNTAYGSKSLVTQIMEIQSTGWGRWKHKYFAKLDKTVPYVILCQVAGLRDYIAANPVPDTTVTPDSVSRNANLSASNVEAGDSADATDEFYDAIAAEVTEEEEMDDDSDDESDDEEVSRGKKGASNRFKNTALALMRLTPHARAEEQELGPHSDKVEIDISWFKGSLPQAVSTKDSSCWTDPGGEEFMVRGKTYPSDGIKVSGGEPLLKLLAVDWLQSESRIDFVARHPKYLVQSEAGKKLPFILVINLQVPAKPNYSMIFYFGAERPIGKGSLLDSFVNGSDAYRDSRFKLIPRIVKGYWFVKRAVGTKACLLGQAVSCKYLREDNFLEIDVDIGSSSVARSIINLVLKHVTSLVVDMAVLIEGRKESELPEYFLGTTRVIQLELDSAVSYK